MNLALCGSLWRENNKKQLQGRCVRDALMEKFLDWERNLAANTVEIIFICCLIRNGL